MSEKAAERAIEALIDAEPMIPADATLHADAVRRAIGRAQGVDVSNITVRSRNGDITLLGTVPEPPRMPAEVASRLATPTSRPPVAGQAAADQPADQPIG